MNTENDIYRKLHHIGVFLIGLSAIISCIYFVFIKKDPYAEIRNAATQSVLDSFNDGGLFGDYSDQPEQEVVNGQMETTFTLDSQTNFQTENIHIQAGDIGFPQTGLGSIGITLIDDRPRLETK